MSKLFGECPSCDGFGDHGIDEAGCWLVCYACGGSGKVPAEVAIEARRDRAWSDYVAAEAAIKRRVELGVPHGWSYRFDDWDGLVLIPPRVAVAAAPVAAEEFEDIPF